jgi:hypothetical protein
MDAEAALDLQLRTVGHVRRDAGLISIPLSRSIPTTSIPSK